MPDPITALSLAKDFAVPVVSAALGALLAYVPSARLAKRAASETLARDREQREGAELADGRRAFVKLALIANTLASYRQQVEGMITKADRDGNDHMPLHRRISTFAGIEHEPPIAFDAAELAPFVSARRPDLLDELLLLQRHHSAVIQSLRTFARLRLELHYGMAGLGNLSRDENLVSTIRASVPAELARVFVAKSDELELFTTEMRRQLNAATAHSERVAQLFDEVATAHFGPGQLPSLKPAGDDPARSAV